MTIKTLYIAEDQGTPGLGSLGQVVPCGLEFNRALYLLAHGFFH